MKKYLLLFFTFHFLISLSFSQGFWSPRASLPDSARGEGISFSIGNYGYVGLGENYEKNPFEFYNDFWQFNPSDNSWTRKANFPGKARVWPATFVIGNYAYVITGRDSGLKDYLIDCWQYNTITDKWTQKANFPGTARAYDVGFAIGGKGYVGLGRNTLLAPSFYKDFWVYDTATNSWAAIANFGGIARWCASAFAVEGKGYVYFGQDSALGNNLLMDTWAYDTGINSWIQKSNYPGLSIFGAAGFVIQNNIFIGTGQDGTDKLNNTFWKYNTSKDTWTNQVNFPDKRASCFSFSIGDTGYMGLGWDTVTHVDYSNSLYRFFPDSVTGIGQIYNSTTIAIYPNPFSTETLIKAKEKFSGNPEFFLYDIRGNRIEIGNLPVSGGDNTYVLKRNGLSNGVYMLAMKYNDQLFYKKLIIIN